MKIIAKIGSPVYETISVYGKTQPVKRVKDECKKFILLDVIVDEFVCDVGELIYDKIFEELKKKHNNIISLSQCSWWEMLENEETNYFKASICVPKDFDHLEEQKKTLLTDARAIIRELKRGIRSKYNYQVVCDSESHRGTKYYIIDDDLCI